MARFSGILQQAISPHRGCNFAALGLRFNAQGLHFAAQGLHFAAQGLLHTIYNTQPLHSTHYLQHFTHTHTHTHTHSAFGLLALTLFELHSD